MVIARVVNHLRTEENRMEGDLKPMKSIKIMNSMIIKLWTVEPHYMMTIEDPRFVHPHHLLLPQFRNALYHRCHRSLQSQDMPNHLLIQTHHYCPPLFTQGIKVGIRTHLQRVPWTPRPEIDTIDQELKVSNHHPRAFSMTNSNMLLNQVGC